VDTQAHRQPDALVRRQSHPEEGYGIEDFQPCPHGPLGVVLVRLRIAEIDQQAIPQVLRDVAVKALDHVGTGGLIGAYDLAIVFQVELSGEGSRVHEVAK
jgi:hypothetical protein